MENTVEKKMNSKEQVLLTKKDINKSFYRWYFDAEVSNCYERQQGVAFCYSMIPCLSGIGDTIDWGTLKTIIYGIAVTFGITGNVLGAIIPFAFMLITFFIGKNLWALGYKIGKESVKSILQAGWVKELISATSILGLFMMGALSASYVTLTTALKFKIAGTEIILQDILDSIAPGILPLLVVFGIYYILKNKSQKYGLISLGIVLICILGAFIGLF